MIKWLETNRLLKAKETFIEFEVSMDDMRVEGICVKQMCEKEGLLCKSGNMDTCANFFDQRGFLCKKPQKHTNNNLTG